MSRSIRALGFAVALVAAGSAQPSVAYAPCERWSVERLRPGMHMDEVRELGYAPHEPAPAAGRSGAGVRVGVSASGAWKVPIRDPRGRWKGRLNLKNGRVSKVRLTYPEVAPTTMLERILPAIDQQRPSTDEWVFKSEACNTSLIVKPHGKRGTRVTLRPLYGIDASRR